MCRHVQRDGLPRQTLFSDFFQTRFQQSEAPRDPEQDIACHKRTVRELTVVNFEVTHLFQDCDSSLVALLASSGDLWGLNLLDVLLRLQHDPDWTLVAPHYPSDIVVAQMLRFTTHALQRC